VLPHQAAKPARVYFNSPSKCRRRSAASGESRSREYRSAVDPNEIRRRIMAYTRREILFFIVVLALCVGLFLGGNRSPFLLAVVIVAVIVIAGESWLRRRIR